MGGINKPLTTSVSRRTVLAGCGMLVGSAVGSGSGVPLPEVTFMSSNDSGSTDSESPAHETTLLVVLQTDDVWTNQMALNYATKALDGGYPLVLFFNVRAVTLVNTAVPQHTGALSEQTPLDTVEDLLAQGATVYVCRECTEQAGLSEDDWVAGTKAGGPELIDLQMAPDTKTLTY